MRLGHMVVARLSNKVTSQKVTGLIPDVKGFFQLI
jgi:hypothetical protein